MTGDHNIMTGGSLFYGGHITTLHRPTVLAGWSSSILMAKSNQKGNGSTTYWWALNKNMYITFTFLISLHVLKYQFKISINTAIVSVSCVFQYHT